MFDTLEDFSNKLTSTGYFIDPVMTQVVFLAARLQKPLLLEGPAGSGKFGTCCPSKDAKTNSPQSASIASSASTSFSATLINPAFCSRNCIQRKPKPVPSCNPLHLSPTISPNTLEDTHASVRPSHPLALYSLRRRRSHRLPGNQDGMAKLPLQREATRRHSSQPAAPRTPNLNPAA